MNYLLNTEAVLSFIGQRLVIDDCPSGGCPPDWQTLRTVLSNAWFDWVDELAPVWRNRLNANFIDELLDKARVEGLTPKDLYCFLRSEAPDDLSKQAKFRKISAALRDLLFRRGKREVPVRLVQRKRTSPFLMVSLR